MMIAEESTSWPAVTGDTEQGGLGFTFKWDLGWMHDTLDYLSRNAVHRRFHQGELTFRAIYAANEHFMLPLSHDEVVHGKGSVLARMAGDEWQKRANLRLLFGYQFTLPGKKLLFMGELVAHEEQLLPGQGELVAEQEAQVRALLPLVPGHAREHRSLAVDHLVVAEREHEVLVGGVDRPEGELTLVEAPVDGVAREVVQRVVHPSEVPLEGEAQAALLGVAGHGRPRGRLLGDHHDPGDCLLYT